MHQMTQLDDLDDETREVAITALRFKASNAQIIQRLDQQGAEVNFNAARYEFLIIELVGMGILTERQAWELDLSWQKHIRPQLLEVEKKMIEMKRKRPFLVPESTVNGSNKHIWKPGDN